MRCLRPSLFAVVIVLLFTARLMGQGVEITPRITGPVDEKSLVTFKGNVSSLARAEFDTGEAPASTRLSYVRVVLARTRQQQAALDQYDSELQDKSSPNFHKWLTPEQFGKLYGPADSDIAAITSWLGSHGLTVLPLSPGRISIAFSGTVQQIEEAFHTSIHSYQAHGEQFFSNATNPSIPSALAAVVSGVANLNTIKPRPSYVRSHLGTYDPAAKRMMTVPSPTRGGPRAELTGGSGSCPDPTLPTCDPYVLYVVAGDAATMYDTPNAALNANFPSGGTNYTGKGVVIGYAGDAVIQPSTVVDYRMLFVGDKAQPMVTNVDGVTATGDTDEAYLDAEIAGGLAPGATIHFYTAQHLDTAMDQAINDNTVDIFNVSFGLCELGMTTADNTVQSNLWQQAATQGIAVTVSTGDSGSAGCDSNTPNTNNAATYGLMVNGLASTPYNIAVGGTDTYWLVPSGTVYNPTNFLKYVLPTPDPSVDQSAVYYRTALKYIPESTWNDSVQNDGVLANNIPYLDSFNNASIIAGGGGASSCSTNTTTTTPGTCTSGYPKPVWQRGAGVPNDSVRDLPDVSLMAGAGGDYAAWLVCTDETGLNGSGVTITANCTTQSDNQFYFIPFGGTSAAAPAFAGILALVQEKASGRLGQAAEEIYDLYNGTHSAAIFHDIAVGNISVPCVASSPDCTTNTAGFPFLTGYDAGVGYDLATGLGSVDATKLISYWGTGVGPGATTVTVTPSAPSIVINTGLAVDVTVAGSPSVGTPTGTVVLTSGAFNSGTETLSNGTFTFHISPGLLARGSDTLTATYSGDVAYDTNTGTNLVTVNGVTPTVTVKPSTVTPNSGDSLTVMTTVAGAAATPTGTVTLTGGGFTSQPGTLNSAGAFTFTIPAFSLAGGTDPLTVSYSGDNTYIAGTGTATVTVAQTAFAITATPVTVTAGDTSNNVSNITVTPMNGYLGSISLTAAVTSSPSGAVNPPTFTVNGSPVIISSTTPVTTATVAVGTTAVAAIVRANGHHTMAWFRAAGGTAFFALLFFVLPFGSRRARRLLSAFLVVIAVGFAAAGCGGGSSSGGGGGSQKTTPSVTVSPTKNAISVTDMLPVAITVSGGSATATGSVTLTSGTYTSGTLTLSSGGANVTIPANSLTAGSDTLTATYSGDTNFNTATGTAALTVNKPGTTAGTYTVTVTGVGNDLAATKATGTFTLTVN